MSNKKTHSSTAPGIPVNVMVWCAVLALSALRISVAVGGAPTEQEAVLIACSNHPAAGYVEGAAGAPLLLALLQMVGLSGISVIRWIPVLATLLLSWCVWWIGRRVAPHRPALALWSLLAVNALPPVTSASLVMNGAMVTAALLLLAVVAGWHAVLAQGGGVLRAWALFGMTMAVATLFWLPAGMLLPVSIGLRFIKHGVKSFPWRGVTVALGVLLLGAIAQLSWNAKNRWVGWYGVAEGWDTLTLAGHQFPLGLTVAVSACMVPWLVLLAFRSRAWSIVMLVIAVSCVSVSGLWLMMPGMIPAAFPSPVGVKGLGRLSETILALRKDRPDPREVPSFLIASTPGLAALLGSRIVTDYPERPGAPPVFAAESPSMNSSYSFWPSYPDAVASGKPDNLYTEEKSASPFLGRNALYITTESKEELPQTITGAFGAVALLKEVPIEINGRTQIIRIYQCEDYRTLSL